MKGMLYGIAALLVVGCGGLASSTGGDAGADGGRPDGPTHVDSEAMDGGTVDDGSGDSSKRDAARDSGRDVAVADVTGDAPSCPEAGHSGSPPPSCAPGGPGITNCGPGGSGTESCCTSLEVTGGTYYRTYTSEADGGPTGEADPATVSTFRLDKYLVTVGRFRQFVSEWSGGSGLDGGTGYEPPAGSGKHTYLNSCKGLANSGDPGTYETGWDATDDSNIAPTNINLTCDPSYASYATWTNTAGSQENLPINCVNWYESYAFCIWDGGFLPSEAEWEYAAAGGSQQREYPWGSMAPGKKCPGAGCEYAIYGCYYPSGSGSCTGVTNIAPVGTPVVALVGIPRIDAPDCARRRAALAKANS